MPFLTSEACFWPLTASMTSEVKNNYAYVFTQDVCNKFIGSKLLCGIYGFTTKSSISTLNILRLLIRFMYYDVNSTFYFLLHLVFFMDRGEIRMWASKLQAKSLNQYHYFPKRWTKSVWSCIQIFNYILFRFGQVILVSIWEGRTFN